MRNNKLLKPQKENKQKLKPYQIALIVGASILFVVATIIFIVFYYQAIFSVNVFCWALLILFIIAIIFGFTMYRNITNGK